MRISVVTGDITRIDADVVVNAANSSLMGGGGVDGAIHRAGGPAILEECRKVRESLYPDGLPVGEAVATTAGDLPARHVIHTVGPVYGREAPGTDVRLLRRCYTRCLEVAAGLGVEQGDDLATGAPPLETIAFPLISAGAYGWPKDDAIRQALLTLENPHQDGTGWDPSASPLSEALLVLFDADDLSVAYEIAESEGVFINSGHGR